MLKSHNIVMLLLYSYNRANGREKKNRNVPIFSAHSSNFSHILPHARVCARCSFVRVSWPCIANQNCHEDVNEVNNNVEQACPCWICWMQTQLSVSFSLCHLRSYWSSYYKWKMYSVTIFWSPFVRFFSIYIHKRHWHFIR